MSKAGRRRNMQRRAQKQDRFAELDSAADRQRLDDGEMWEYATLLAPIGPKTLQAYQQVGMGRQDLIANRTIGIDFFHLLQSRFQFKAIAVEGRADAYTVSLAKLMGPVTVPIAAKHSLIWQDLTSAEAGIPMGVGEFLGWLNASAYSAYRHGDQFRDIHED
jgi:hypothetical protein